MTRSLKVPSLSGTLAAIPSKSYAHRLLICSALADAKTDILCRSTSEDIRATARCLAALGAGIKYENGIYTVEPIGTPADKPHLECGESGSTLRLLLPLTLALCGGGAFAVKGSLAERPIQPLLKALESHGAITQRSSDGTVYVSGDVIGREWSIATDISSQFVSGLLLMLTVTGGRLRLEGKQLSAGYVDMTCASLRAFGADLSQLYGAFEVKKTYPLHSPRTVSVEGDWSNAAFFITAGVLGKGAITVEGLDPGSRQGDRAIVELLRSMGADIVCEGGAVTAYPSELRCVDIDASQVPDLVPVLAVAAAAARGTSRIYGAQHLRLKESDRLDSIEKMLSALGASVLKQQDGLVITGGRALHGGTVSSAGDHRIAMSAAVAATLCSGEVCIQGAAAVNKSYPDFWRDFDSLTVSG